MHSLSKPVHLLANCSLTEDYDPPCLANFIVVVTAVTGDKYDCTDIYGEEGMKEGILKVALNSLKITYL